MRSGILLVKNVSVPLPLLTIVELMALLLFTMLLIKIPSTMSRLGFTKLIVMLMKMSLNCLSVIRPILLPRRSFPTKLLRNSPILLVSSLSKLLLRIAPTSKLLSWPWLEKLCKSKFHLKYNLLRSGMPPYSLVIRVLSPSLCPLLLRRSLRVVVESKLVASL